MNYLEKQFNKLPKFKLSNKANFKFYWNLIKKLINNSLNMKNLKLVVSSIVAFVLLLGGTATYAYTNVSVTKGEVLYSLKSGLEKIEVSLASDGLEKVQVNLKMADRRIAEAKYLAAVGDFDSASKIAFINVVHAQEVVITDSILAQTIDSAVVSTETAIAESATITDPQTLSKALDVIEIAQSLQVEDLLTIAEDVSDVNDVTATVVAIAVADTQENLTTLTDVIAVVDQAIIEGDYDIKVKIQGVREKRVNTPVTQEEAQLALDEFIVKKSTIEASISATVTDPQMAQKLIDKLNTKADQVAQAISDGNYNKAKGLVKASNVISENVEHFAQKREEQKDKKEEKQKKLEQKRDELKAEFKIKKDKLKAQRDELKAEYKKMNQEQKDTLKKEREIKIQDLHDNRIEENDLIKKEFEQKRKEFKKRIRSKNDEDKESIEQDREELKDSIENHDEIDD